MKVEYLYNSRGNWIAFKKDAVVFNTEGEWIGWLPWEDGDVVDTEGNYLGTIYPPNRLYRKVNRPRREYPGYPGFQDPVGYPGYPGHAGPAPVPVGAEDLAEVKGVR